MSEIKFTIFNPLNEYFQIIFADCPTNDFSKGCNPELLKLLTNKCDKNGNKSNPNEISKNFKEAAEQFAYNLKLADNPISKITIKGTLFEDFKKAFKAEVIKIKPEYNSKSLETIESKIYSDLNSEQLINKIKEEVANDPLCKKINFSLDNIAVEGSSKKYIDFLIDEFEFSKTVSTDIFEGKFLIDIVKKMFNSWLNNSFDKIYQESKTYFNETFLEELNKGIPDGYVNPCHKYILENYFEIVSNDSQGVISWKSFWGTASSADWGSLKNNISKIKDLYRLNIMVVKDDHPFEQTKKDKRDTEYNNNIAKITLLFPASFRDTFNSYLIKPDIKLNNLSYSYAGTDCSTYKVSNLKEILEFFKNEIVANTSKPAQKNEEYILDVPDKEPYTDDDVDKTQYLLENLEKEIINYKDTWAADLSGELYYRKKNTDGTYSKWEIYSDDKKENDIKSFMEGSTTEPCGKLCIFSNPQSCKEFFERLTKQDRYTIDELANVINSENFVRSYLDLKTNIIHVNPSFVLGTLRMFNFEKNTKFIEDGTKTVKVETFTRWWNRLGNKIKDVSKDKNYPSGVFPSEDTKFPGTHHQPDLLPDPPANLELFLKLLISFINNNEFVLNPQLKELINKLPFTKIDSHGSIDDEPEYFINYDSKGNQIKVKNGAYQSKTNKSDGESIANLLLEMKKNATTSFKPVNMASSDNYPSISALLGLMVGITNGGNIRLSKTSPFSTGYGYITGGASGNANKFTDIIKNKEIVMENLENLKPCSRDAILTYVEGVNYLEKYNKKIDDPFLEDLKENIEKLMISEDKVYEKLQILLKYKNIISILDDKNRNDKITEDIMKNVIDAYERSTINLSKRVDSTQSLLLRTLFSEQGPSSYYSPIE